jgi:large subunit ribosomal protein L25
MSVSFELNVQLRDVEGKGASRRLRRDGKVPGIIYGGGKDPAMITVVHNELLQHLEHEAFYSHVLTVNLGGQEERVILKDLQRHPSKPFVLHLDLQRVSATEKIRVHVPLHFIGEEVAPGVKQGGAVSHSLTDVEVSCLPQHLPEFIEIDMSGMEIGDTVHISDIVVPEGVEIPLLVQGPEHDLPVVAIHAARGGAAGEEGEEGEEAEETED